MGAGGHTLARGSSLPLAAGIHCESLNCPVPVFFWECENVCPWGLWGLPSALSPSFHKQFPI